MLSKATWEVLYIKIYSGLKYIFLKLFWNFWNGPVPNSKPYQLVLSWLQLFMSTVASPTSFGFQQCIICFYSCVYVIMQYFVILIVHRWKINLLLLMLIIVLFIQPHQVCFPGRRQRHNRCHLMQAFPWAEVQQFHLIQETPENAISWSSSFMVWIQLAKILFSM